MNAASGNLPNAASVKADYESLEQAAQWYAEFHTGNADGERRDIWAQWLRQRPENRRAWQHIEAVSTRFDALRAQDHRAAAAAAFQAVTKHRVRRRSILNGVASIGTIGLAGWWGCRFTPIADVLIAWHWDYSTKVGEQRRIVLTDGTTVWLNTDSAFNASYDAAQRRVSLEMGEILIDTARDARDRPFYVETRFGTLQALGTKFAVRQFADTTLLAVFEGLVEIRTDNGLVARVPAGRQRRFSATAMSDVSSAEPRFESWRSGVLIADNMNLETLVHELDRYHHGYIAVAPEVADLKVVGRYPALDKDHTLTMLARDLPVRIQQIMPWWTAIKPR